MTFFEFWQQVSVYSVLVPIIVGWATVSYLDYNSKAVLVLMVIASFPQLASGMMNPATKNIAYNLYSVVEYVFWSWLFYTNISHTWMRRIIIMLLVIFIGVGFVQMFRHPGIDSRFFNELQCINSIVQVILVLFYFYSLSLGESEFQLQREPLFWFAMAFLLYAPSTYFYFAFYNEIRIKQLYPETKLIHNILNAFLYLIIAIGMYTNKIGKNTIPPHDIP